MLFCGLGSVLISWSEHFHFRNNPMVSFYCQNLDKYSQEHELLKKKPEVLHNCFKIESAAKPYK